MTNGTTNNRSTVSRTKAAFTLLELLCTISIIGLLLAIAVPAVQSAVEASRRVQCASRLRQIGVALQQYESNHSFLPSPSLTRLIGVGSDVPYPSFRYSVHSHLLPYLDESTAYDFLNFSIRQPGDVEDTYPDNTTAAQVQISTFLCPSDTGRKPFDRAGPNSYRFCSGPGDAGYADADNTWRNNGAFAWSHPIRGADITDGLHTTIGVSEKRIGSGRPAFRPAVDVLLLPVEWSSPPIWPNADQWAQFCKSPPAVTKFRSDNGATWLVADYHYTMYNHALSPNDWIVDCGRFDTHPKVGLFPARSWHPGGVYTMYMDGSVRFMRDNIDLTAWRALSTRSGGEQSNGF